jgi:hypothetical protein
LLANCALNSDDPPVTNDLTYPCPWGHSNMGAYLNGDEQECGNGVIDLGEDCDEDPYNPGSLIPAGETCASLGHGPGPLTCTTTPRACTWNTSGCAAPTCTEYGASRVRLRNVLGPSGDDQLLFTARGLVGGTFDPVTQDLSFVFRDDGGLVLSAVVPGGSGGWTSSGSEFAYSDPSGTHDGVLAVSLRGSPSFASRFRARVLIRAPLGAAADARTGTAVLRVGDDCWSDTTPCTAGGSNVTCRGKAQP